MTLLRTICVSPRSLKYLWKPRVRYLLRYRDLWVPLAALCPLWNWTPCAGKHLCHITDCFMDLSKHHRNTLLVLKPHQHAHLPGPPLSENPVDPEIFESHFDCMLLKKPLGQICTFYSSQTTSSPFSKTCLSIISKPVIHTWLFLQHLYIGAAQHLLELDQALQCCLKSFIGLPPLRPHPVVPIVRVTSDWLIMGTRCIFQRTPQPSISPRVTPFLSWLTKKTQRSSIFYDFQEIISQFITPSPP